MAVDRVDEVPLKQILFVESYPQSLYGQQETLLALLERCAGRGITPVVATPMDGCFVETLRARGFQVEIVAQPCRLAQYGGALYREGLRERCQSFGQAASYLRIVRRWLRDRPFNAVFCNDMRALLTFGVAARSLALPVLIWDKLDKPHGWLDHLQLPPVKRNLIISQAVTAKYPPWQRRWLRSRIRCVFNGVPIRASNETRERPLPPVSPGAIVVAIVGTVTPRKGHDLLLAAFWGRRYTRSSGSPAP